MKKSNVFLMAILLLATTALQAQTGNIVTMKTTKTKSISIMVKYTGTGTIKANGTTLNNGLNNGGNYTSGIIPAADNSITITSTGSIRLTMLDVQLTALTQLNVSNAIYLTELYCNDNKLTHLSLPNSTALTQLACSNNQLSQLDVSKYTALKNLWCYSNQLSQLDVSKNTTLNTLSCSRNKLMQLDVSKNTVLKELSCDNNKLVQLDVSKNAVLKKLECSENKLAQLNVSKNIALTELRCNSNRLSSLDLSKNLKLTILDANNQAVEVVVLPGATTFPNPIYYCNKTAVSPAEIGGTAYAHKANVPKSSGRTVNFTTDNGCYKGNGSGSNGFWDDAFGSNTFTGSAFAGVITFVFDNR